MPCVFSTASMQLEMSARCVTFWFSSFKGWANCLQSLSRRNICLRQTWRTEQLALFNRQVAAAIAARTPRSLRASMLACGFRRPRIRTTFDAQDASTLSDQRQRTE
jgi:hypothetical protein